MYKFELPTNCPPTNAYERNIELYRLFDPSNLIESFKNHIELYPERVNYLSECNAYALSFFDTIDGIKNILAKENNEGKRIAKVKIEERHGKLSDRSKKGHYSLWPYKDFDINSIAYEFIDV